jgi:hypothetical protein
MSDKEKRPPKATVIEVNSVEDFKKILGMMGMDPETAERAAREATRARATDIPMNGFAEIDGGPALPAETAIAGALTALHQAAHDLLVADGVLPSEAECGRLTAKLLGRGLRRYVDDGPPSDAERDAFNEEWQKQADAIAPVRPDCPCPRCTKARRH